MCRCGLTMCMCRLTVWHTSRVLLCSGGLRRKNKKTHLFYIRNMMLIHTTKEITKRRRPPAHMSTLLVFQNNCLFVFRNALFFGEKKRRRPPAHRSTLPVFKTTTKHSLEGRRRRPPAHRSTLLVFKKLLFGEGKRKTLEAAYTQEHPT